MPQQGGHDSLIVLKKPQSLHHNAPEPYEDTLELYQIFPTKKQLLWQETAHRIGPAWACTTETGQPLVLVHLKQDGMGSSEYINAYYKNPNKTQTLQSFTIIDMLSENQDELHLLRQCPESKQNVVCLCRVEHFKRFDQLLLAGLALLGNQNTPYASGIIQDTLALQTIDLSTPKVLAFLRLADSLASPDTSVFDVARPYAHTARWQNSTHTIHQITVRTHTSKGLSLLLRYHSPTKIWSLIDASVSVSGQLNPAQNIRLTESHQLQATLCKSYHSWHYAPDTVIFDFLHHKLYKTNTSKTEP